MEWRKEATDKKYIILKEVLYKEQLYIKEMKQNKLIRDDNDYQNGRIGAFAQSHLWAAQHISTDNMNREARLRAAVQHEWHARNALHPGLLGNDVLLWNGSVSEQKHGPDIRRRDGSYEIKENVFCVRISKCTDGAIGTCYVGSEHKPQRTSFRSTNVYSVQEQHNTLLAAEKDRD
ncbi:hypothetical protein NDU88_007651 [Pleurodeles waltl]|uniref:Uncharacterized protein n=1 Tax=Pleurodeles waltl TaxID=8319 RepID=A0AAV7VQC6_PLEWA|nr:hypothetical protein NDU88_007651 [Pleurodeles waltl]